MHQASVGFHCPECVKASGQKVYTARTLRANAGATITTALVAANVAIYVLSTAAGGGSPLGPPSSAFLSDWGLVGDAVVRLPTGFEAVGVADGEWYRLITGGFLHGGLMHIGFNMYVLWILGKQLEPAIGRVAFGAVYATSLLAGAFGVMLLDPGALTVGASGAVFGMFGLALVAQWARGINPMDTGLGGIILLNLGITFVIPNISIGGHLGGLIGGAIAGLLIDVVRPKLGLPPWAGTVLVVLLGVAFAAGSIAVA